MARLASAIACALILLSPIEGEAGDLFSGFQMADDGRYFAHLGAREELPWEAVRLQPFAQFFVASQRYAYKSNDRIVDADVQSLVPSLGLGTQLGPWHLLGLVGPELRWKRERGFLDGTRRDFEAGVFAQLEGIYWQETHSIHALVSYGALDHFVFSRLRGKARIYSSEEGCCQVQFGWDLAGMGNSDFRAVQTGPLIEVPIGKVFLLAKGGYQHDSEFGSSGYGGLEIYAPLPRWRSKRSD